jgi:hypothetical protein
LIGLDGRKSFFPLDVFTSGLGLLLLSDSNEILRGVDLLDELDVFGIGDTDVQEEWSYFYQGYCSYLCPHQQKTQRKH